MNDAEPGLFEWTPEDSPKAPSRRPQRGRNRETWALTATAEVVIVDAAAVDEALAQAEVKGLMIGWDDVAVDAEPALDDSTVEPTTGPLDQLAWLIWPTEGQDALMDAGAFRVLIVDSGMIGQTDERGTATWTITVKLTHVDRLRQLAARAHPDETAAIEDSLSIAWQRAADPFAPLRSIPGIEWRPVSVHVEHVPARPATG